MAIDKANDETKLLPGIPETKEVVDETTKEVEDTGDEVLVSIGEAPPASEDEETVQAPEWVKDLRKQQKELVKKTRELEAENAQLKQATQPAKVELGVKPTLEACDYDAEKFETELTNWHERKRQADAEVAKREKKVNEDKQAWSQTLQGYETAKVNLKVKDFDDAEDNVKNTLSVVQQGIILQGSSDSATVVYALGKHEEELQRLAKIKDPIKFAFAVAKLEGQLKVSTRKAPPPEEKVKSGSAPLSGGNTNATLERLRAEADKTGNYSKVIAYKNQLKAQAKR